LGKGKVSGRERMGRGRKGQGQKGSEERGGNERGRKRRGWNEIITNKGPLYWLTCASWHSQLRIGGFCHSKVLAPACHADGN